MSSQPSQRVRAPHVAWTKEEVERLVGWMEDNYLALRGKQMAWYKQVKDEVFFNDEHITVKKINDKAFNMKKAWKEAKAMQEQSGWGTKPEENEASVNCTLERKCPFFWRLEEVWGIRPNATVIVNSTAPLQQAPMQAPPPTPSQSTIPDASQSSIVLDVERAEDDTLEWTPSPPPKLSFPPPHSRSRSPRSSTLQSSTPRSSTPRPSTPAPRTGKHDLGMLLKETLDARHSRKTEIALKKHKAEMELKKEEIDVKREAIATKERLAQIQADMQAKQADAQARQADAQARQTESFTRLMEKMVGTIQGSKRRPDAGRNDSEDGEASMLRRHTAWPDQPSNQ